ncbi:hypothetical protein ADK75_07395 [Streptomyces virginiae]|uniref:Uncharacterized protein n=1 Tax=Streptomyces virginiae TaxID=1961 RepID=A0A0L8N1F9_STRVG|nr:hypothetical protein ADK75_07395 [Streptomyces virginiae]
MSVWWARATTLTAWAASLSPGHGTQLGPVDADHVGQCLGVALIALGPGRSMAFLEAVDLAGVDREHLSACTCPVMYGCFKEHADNTG